MSINISHLTESELLALNAQVVKRVKSLRREEAATMGASLSVGDKVSFISRAKYGGGLVYGTIYKVNRVKCKVRTTNGINWNVAISCLSRV